MQYSDYPHTLAAIKRHLPSIEGIRPSHGGAMAVINTVRAESGLSPLDIDELVLATLGRIEDTLDTSKKTIMVESTNED